jgi:hypothetical protein
MVAAWLKNEFLAADSAHIHWSTTKMPGQRRKSPFSPAGWGILQEVQWTADNWGSASEANGSSDENWLGSAERESDSCGFFSYRSISSL